MSRSTVVLYLLKVKKVFEQLVAYSFTNAGIFDVYTTLGVIPIDVVTRQTTLFTRISMECHSMVSFRRIRI